MTPYSFIPLIIADGDFPTTRLVARELGVVHGQVEIRIPDSLFGAELAGRQVVISRLCQPFLSWLPDYFSQRGLRYAYLLDDNFWELPPEMDEVVAPFYNHPAVLATLERYVRGAAVVIVWSERMRQYLVDRFPRSKVEMVPCGVDLEQIERMRPQSSAAHEDVIRIGYPTSRRPGVAALLTEIVRMLGAKYAHRVQFEFMGWMPETLEGLPNVTLTPQIAEYDRYLQFVCARQWDIGLAPLIGGHFESFKTDVKYREYAGLRVPGVYSRVSPYTDTVVDGQTGILVENDPQAWVAALEMLIATPLLRRRVVEAAYADVRTHRDLRVTGARFAALLPSHASGAGSS